MGVPDVDETLGDANFVCLDTEDMSGDAVDVDAPDDDGVGYSYCGDENSDELR